MSVVIVGGHDRMVCLYKGICQEYGCKAKVYTQEEKNLERLIGCPDLIILFTKPVSHRMAKIARDRALCHDIAIVQSHSGSGNALRNILSAKTSFPKEIF